MAAMRRAELPARDKDDTTLSGPFYTAFLTYNPIEEGLRLRDVPLPRCVERGLEAKRDREHRRRTYTTGQRAFGRLRCQRIAKRHLELHKTQLAHRAEFAHIVCRRVEVVQQKKREGTVPKYDTGARMWPKGHECPRTPAGSGLGHVNFQV
ncbi:hypothetical protein KIPB_011616 [Kipferlia bialata]|uniref:Uncharacterized protein n=1 Tax=Kipferlia bialata TaxID=797122 RepID=A0A9K3D5D9_9EUKA|nr:hypothetical protein KIPB_011616 [Kipferlia bialata]|eukprot:g11616.t1